jgi:hypothetical protein
MAILEYGFAKSEPRIQAAHLEFTPREGRSRRIVGDDSGGLTRRRADP